MKSKPSPRQDDPEQSKRFVKAAIEAGVDDNSDAVFERVFRTVARPVERDRKPSPLKGRARTRKTKTI